MEALDLPGISGLHQHDIDLENPRSVPRATANLRRSSDGPGDAFRFSAAVSSRRMHTSFVARAMCGVTGSSLHVRGDCRGTPALAPARRC